MFFLLSKTVYILLLPTSLILIGLLSAFFIKNKRCRDKLLFSVTLLFIFFTNPFLASKAMSTWEFSDFPELSATSKVRVGVVLTGVMKTREDAKNYALFDRGVTRPVKAFELYKKGIISHILLSGGDAKLIGKEIPESERMKRFLLDLGVQSEHLLIENQSRNTYENAYFTKKTLEDFSETNVLSQSILITSAFHLPRSLACFRAQGLEMIPYPVDFWSQSITLAPTSWLFPSARALVLWERLAKEWLGFMAYWIAGYI
jgi:uncharacterized SAM-binding protein YcdF (DUF218 family)